MPTFYLHYNNKSKEKAKTIETFNTEESLSTSLKVAVCSAKSMATVDSILARLLAVWAVSLFPFAQVTALLISDIDKTSDSGKSRAASSRTNLKNE